MSDDRTTPEKDRTYDVPDAEVGDVHDPGRDGRALRHQLELEKKLARIARRFVGIEPGELRGGIEDGLRLGAEIAGSDRCDLALVNASRDGLDRAYTWAREGVAPGEWITGREQIGDFFWSGARLGQGQPVHVPDVAVMPDEARGERAGAERLGIVSFLSIPVFGEAGFEGYVTFSRCFQPKRWTEAEITLLSVLAEVFGNAARRREAETELGRQFEFGLQVVDLSQRLLSLTADEIDAEIQVALERAASLVHADCGYLFSLRDDARAFDAYAWHGENVPMRSRRLDRTLDAIPEWALRDVAQIRSVDHIPEEEAVTRAAYQERGIRAALWIPVLRAGTPIGVLCFECTSRMGSWTQYGINLLTITGQLIATALRRKRHEEELEEQRIHLLRAQKMEAVGRLAGGIAHDFNNLLTVIGGNASILRDNLPAEDPIAEGLDQISEAASRAGVLTRQLLSFSRRPVSDVSVVDLSGVVRGLSDVISRLLGEASRLDLDVADEPVLIEADPNQLEQVIVNLSVNARDAMPAGGVLTLRACVARFDHDGAKLVGLPDAGEYAVLEVADTGDGMSPETIERATEPFFTTKAPDKGTGLGLYMVYGIARQGGGTLAIESELGVGTRIRFMLPRNEGEGVHGDDARAAMPSTGGSETILVVEDEPAVRRLLRLILERAGYRLLIAEHGEEAIALAAGFAGEIQLLVSDMVMPGMGGQQVARAIRAERPDIGVLFITGYAEGDPGADDLGAQTLPKPFGREDLLQHVRSILDANQH